MKILMLGNSLTSANGLPQVLAEKTGAEVHAHTRGGARLAEQANPKTKLGQRTLEALERGHWDYVVLQEMSHGPMTSPERYLASVERLCGLIRAHGAVPVLYGTWAYGPGCPKLAALGVSRAEMHQAMQEAFLQAARENHVPLANVGEAFFSHPLPEALYAPDGVHPSEAGTRLAAELLAASVLA